MIKGFQNSNQGIISVNKNYGIRNAKGEFIAFCKFYNDEKFKFSIKRNTL